AVAARAPVVGRNVDCLRRANLDHLRPDTPALPRAFRERRGDRRRRCGGVLELAHGVPPSCRCRDDASWRAYSSTRPSTLADRWGVPLNGETGVWFEIDRQMQAAARVMGHARKDVGVVGREPCFMFPEVVFMNS